MLHELFLLGCLQKAPVHIDMDLINKMSGWNNSWMNILVAIAATNEQQLATDKHRPMH